MGRAPPLPNVGAELSAGLLTAEDPPNLNVLAALAAFGASPVAPKVNPPAPPELLDESSFFAAGMGRAPPLPNVGAELSAGLLTAEEPPNLNVLAALAAFGASVDVADDPPNENIPLLDFVGVLLFASGIVILKVLPGFDLFFFFGALEESSSLSSSPSPGGFIAPKENLGPLDFAGAPNENFGASLFVFLSASPDFGAAPNENFGASLLLSTSPDLGAAPNVNLGPLDACGLLGAADEAAPPPLGFSDSQETHFAAPFLFRTEHAGHTHSPGFGRCAAHGFAPGAAVTAFFDGTTSLMVPPVGFVGVLSVGESSTSPTS